MIKSNVRMPLLCWQCLSKNVVINDEGKVVCPEKECGFTISQVEWMDLAMGSLPTEVNQEWDVKVIDRNGQEVMRANRPARSE